MRNSSLSRFLNLAVAALFILNQAVFLLAPMVPATAQTADGSSGGSGDTSDNDSNDTVMIGMIPPKFTEAPVVAVGHVVFYSATVDETDVTVTFRVLQNQETLKKYEPDHVTGTNIYSLTWDSTELSDGQYDMLVYIEKTGYAPLNDKVSVTVDNVADTDETDDNNVVSGIKLTFTEVPQPITAPVLISVQADTEVESITFEITGPKPDKYTGVPSAGNAYYFRWDITGFPSGEYRISAQAFQDEVPVGDGYIDVKVGQAADETQEPLKIEIIEGPPSPLTGDVRPVFGVNYPVDIFQFIVGIEQSDGTPSKTPLPATRIDEYTYTVTWRTTNFPDGRYNVRIVAKRGEETAEINTSAVIDNDLKETVEDTTPPEWDKITIKELLQPPLSGIQNITAMLSQKAEKVTFVVKSVNSTFSKEYPGIMVPANEYRYYFEWPTADFPNGDYRLIILIRQQGSVVYKQDLLTTKIWNEKIPVDEEEPLNPPEEPDQEILPDCQAQGIADPEICKRYFSLPDECRKAGITSREECDKLFSIPYECRENNLSGEACEQYRQLPYECRQAGITDPEACQAHMDIITIPEECRAAGVTTPEECDKIMASQSFLTMECKAAGITEQEACKTYMTENYISEECREAGVITWEDCKYFLRQKLGDLDQAIQDEMHATGTFEFFDYNEGWPEECREADIASEDECDKLLFTLHSPPECGEAGISTAEECKSYLESLHLPPACREAGASDEAECEKILFSEQAPQECVTAGISTYEECDKFLFARHAPEECLEAGIKTSEACKKFMFEKYGSAENIPADKLPPDCVKAGVTMAAECEQVMSSMYLPQVCRDLGIKDKDKCGIYLNKRNMPEECQAAGVTTRAECDKVMFSKYSPEECQEAGIEDEEVCEKFMYNMYAPKVQCRDIDGWQCQTAIKDRHLGNIVAKQAKFKQIKAGVVKLKEEQSRNNLDMQEAATAGTPVHPTESFDITPAISGAEDVVPIKTKGANLKIVAVVDKIVIDDADNLVQVAPLALMFDADGDGLSDDMEARLGTDPNNGDSDNDGYADGIEVENNFNPKGAGKLEEDIIAPVDQAILAKQPLEQPKVAGVVSENFVVAKVDDRAAAGKEEGYTFAGKAEPNSVVTLYIYSDLPMVVTAKADEYGNWQYELAKSLNDGEHEVYVTLNDNTGKVVAKSNPLNFFIKEAKAVSVEDFIAVAAVIEPPTESESFLKYYMILGAIVTAIGISLFVLLFAGLKKRA